MLKYLLVSGGLAGGNTWGYGDWAWVGLLSVQTQWAEWPPSALEGFYDNEEGTHYYTKYQLRLQSLGMWQKPLDAETGHLAHQVCTDHNPPRPYPHNSMHLP